MHFRHVDMVKGSVPKFKLCIRKVEEKWLKSLWMWLEMIGATGLTTSEVVCENDSRVAICRVYRLVLKRGNIQKPTTLHKTALLMPEIRKKCPDCFLLEHSDGQFRIRCKQHETLVPVHHYLSASAYVSNAADHAHSFTGTVCLSSDGCFKHKAQIISK